MGEANDLDAYLSVIGDGREHEVSEDLFYYFLGVLPPVLFGGTRYHCRDYSFGFAEGNEPVTLFRQEGDKCFARRIPWFNPHESGSFESQKKRLKLQWQKIGKGNPLIGRASDPPFTLEGSFCECLTDRELLEKFRHGNWCLGQAFHVGDLCFIQQVGSGDEWLTIKGNVPFESISFGHIIESDGMDKAQEYLDAIRAATVQECKSLSYRRGR